MIDLSDLGWSDFFEQGMQEFKGRGLQPARVTIENRDCYAVLAEQGDLTAEVAGRLLFASESSAALPKVGDWVALQIFDADDRAIIQHVLPRKTTFSRKAAGKRVDEQVIATNIDVVFVVQSMDNNFNIRRLERTMVVVNESGAEPVILLNKSDLCDPQDTRMQDVMTIAPDVTVLSISAKKDVKLDNLRALIKKGQTFAFIGSSGVGKSTIINRLVGEDVMKTQEVRSADARGRHTTTRRELILLEEGGCLIDTPGMRELQLWQAEEGMSDTFADIDELAESCHFSDCTHTKEIKCAVLAAVEKGELPEKRYESYMKLQKELTALEQRRSKQPPWVVRQKERSQGKMYKQVIEFKKRRKGQ